MVKPQLGSAFLRTIAMTLNDKPQIKTNVRLRNEKFGKLIVAAGLPMLCINHDAVQIVDMANGLNTITDIVAAVSRAYPGISQEHIQRTVLSFIDTLQRLSLLEQNIGKTVND